MNYIRIGRSRLAMTMVCDKLLWLKCIVNVYNYIIAMDTVVVTAYVCMHNINIMPQL